MSPLCPQCQEARNRWLDSKPSQLIPGHYAGPPAVAGLSADGKTIRPWSSTPAATWRWEEWRSTVRFQMDLIARQCRAAKHVADEPPARLIQLDLFAALKAEKGAA